LHKSEMKIDNGCGHLDKEKEERKFGQVKWFWYWTDITLNL